MGCSNASHDRKRGGARMPKMSRNPDSAALGKHLSRTTNNCTITSAADREKVEKLGLKQCSEGDCTWWGKQRYRLLVGSKGRACARANILKIRGRRGLEFRGTKHARGILPCGGGTCKAAYEPPAPPGSPSGAVPRRQHHKQHHIEPPPRAFLRFSACSTAT
jgi:hypothetical protein